MSYKEVADLMRETEQKLIMEILSDLEDIKYDILHDQEVDIIHYIEKYRGWQK